MSKNSFYANKIIFFMMISLLLFKISYAQCDKEKLFIFDKFSRFSIDGAACKLIGYVVDIESATVKFNDFVKEIESNGCNEKFLSNRIANISGLRREILESMMGNKLDKEKDFKIKFKIMDNFFRYWHPICEGLANDPHFKKFIEKGPFYFENKNINFYEYTKYNANNNDVYSMNLLASMYEFGYLTKKDLFKSFYWYKKSAEAGDTTSQFVISSYYFTGLGTKKDIIQAEKWMILACNGGKQDACEMKSTIESKMTNAEIAKSYRLAEEFPEQ